MSSALLDSDSGLPPPSVPAPAAPPGIPSASSGAEHSPSQSPSPPPMSPPTSAFHSVPSKNGASAAASVVPSTSSPKHQMQRKHLRKQRDASPGASSTASDSARESPKRGMTTEEEMEMNNGGKGGAGRDGEDDGQNAFSWPTQSSYDERRQLLCTEEESSDRCSSDEDDEKASAWNITREQLNYYTTQFFSMQPNPRGVIRGETAKEFFEKSRLPITELRKIWQLSDVTKDGSLSMEEFLTAMHLVVLRRNDIELPDELPACLQPLNLRNRLVDRHNKDLYSAEGKQEAKGGEEQSLLSEDTDAPSARQSSPLSPNSAAGRSSNKSPSSVISSPGNRAKPVNFNFRDARRNPNIIQPVPIRHSPESPVIPTSDDDGANAAALPTVKQGRREVIYEQLWNQDVSAAEESLSSMTQRTLRKSENSTDEEEIDDSTEVDGAPLNDDNEDASPAGAKNLPHDGPVSLPQFSDALDLHRRRASGAAGAAGTKDPSPPLPPRSGQSAGVGVGHARSSSLDLNRGVGPPALPPRQLSSGVMSARRDCKSIQMNIGQYKEKNSVVARTINELHQEVSDALEERIALEFQLEQLKSFGE